MASPTPEGSPGQSPFGAVVVLVALFHLAFPVHQDLNGVRGAGLQTFECEFCSETRQLVEEVAELSDLLTAEVYNFVTDKEKAEELGIDKIPAIAIIGAEDYGVRFYGIPSGYEFTSLLLAIKTVAAGKPDLSEEGLQTLAELAEPVHIQVFVTPTCPYCPGSVVLAHQIGNH